MMIRLKIISDGTPAGTKIVDSRTGEEIEGVKSIVWSICHGEFAVAKIELESCSAELIVPDTKIVKPKKKVSESLDVEKEIMPFEDDVPF